MVDVSDRKFNFFSFDVLSLILENNIEVLPHLLSFRGVKLGRFVVWLSLVAFGVFGVQTHIFHLKIESLFTEIWMADFFKRVIAILQKRLLQADGMRGGSGHSHDRWHVGEGAQRLEASDVFEHIFGRKVVFLVLSVHWKVVVVTLVHGWRMKKY